MAGITQSVNDAKPLPQIHNWIDFEPLGSIFLKWCLILPFLTFMILKLNAKLYFHKKNKNFKLTKTNKKSKANPFRKLI